jgi:hypothetical protein
MDQVNAFIDGARKNRDSEMLEIATAFRFAQAAEKDWKRYVGSLTKKDEPRKGTAPKVATSEQIAHLMHASGRKVR